jgi:hypothetical protein
MIKAITIKCPGCDASFGIEDGKKQMYCQYCGTKVIAYDENVFTYNYVDVAKMRELDMQEQAQKEAFLKTQLEKEQLLEQQQKLQAIKYKQTKRVRYGTVSGVCMLFLGFLLHENTIGSLLIIIGIVLIIKTAKTRNKIENETNLKSGMVRYPKSHFNNAHILQGKLVQAGFTNIKMVNLGDIMLGIIKKPGEIKSVSVNGSPAIFNKWLSPNAAIVIEYHGRPGV